MLSRLKNFFAPRRRQRIQASYDLLRRAADTDSFSGATTESANSYDDRHRREQLRALGHYEFKNNPHLYGVVTRIQTECIGSGPRLSIEPMSSSQEQWKLANRLELAWKEYAQEIGFTKKLSTAVVEKIVGGETFAMYHSNRNLETVPVDFTNYEGDQIATPIWAQEAWDSTNNYGPVDGIQLDDRSNPRAYYRLRQDPNSQVYRFADEADLVDAQVMWHWFRQNRPSQYRGVSEVQPTLEVYNKLRRFIEATVQSQELSAKLLGYVSTQAPPTECLDIGDDPINIPVGDTMFPTMPDGWAAHSFPTPDTAEVEQFVNTMLSWAINALITPMIIANSDSSDSNFSSAKLDTLGFFHYIDTLRKEIEREHLCRFYKFWEPFAAAVGMIPTRLGQYRCVWYWDKRHPVDEQKAAAADKTLAEAGLLNPVEYARTRHSANYQDWMRSKVRAEVEELKYRQEVMTELGVEQPAQPQPNQEPVNDDEEQNQET